MTAELSFQKPYKPLGYKYKQVKFGPKKMSCEKLYLFFGEDKCKVQVERYCGPGDNMHLEEKAKKLFWLNIGRLSLVVNKEKFLEVISLFEEILKEIKTGSGEVSYQPIEGWLDGIDYNVLDSGEIGIYIKDRVCYSTSGLYNKHFFDDIVSFLKYMYEKYN